MIFQKRLCPETYFLFVSRSVFCPASTDDEEKDLETQKRIRSFRWITPKHLDAAIDETNEKVMKLIEEAEQGKHH